MISNSQNCKIKVTNNTKPGINANHTTSDMKTQKHLNNKEKNGVKTSNQMNGNKSLSQHHQVQPKSMKYCAEQKLTNGHTVAINIKNVSLTKKDMTIITKNTITTSNKHKGDLNSFPSSSSSFLAQEAYLPKYVEKSFR